MYYDRKYFDKNEMCVRARQNSAILRFKSWAVENVRTNNTHIFNNNIRRFIITFTYNYNDDDASNARTQTWIVRTRVCYKARQIARSQLAKLSASSFTSHLITTTRNATHDSVDGAVKMKAQNLFHTCASLRYIYETRIYAHIYAQQKLSRIKAFRKAPC